MCELNKNEMKWGIFLKLMVTKEQHDVVVFYEKIMPKIIRKWKDNYNMKEYAAVLERSSEGFIHVHIYINQFMPLKEINKQWCDLIGVEDTTKGNLYMKVVESVEHKNNILDYIWKAPLRTWICQEYKNKYGWKTGDVTKRLEESVTPILAVNEKVSKKNERVDRILKQYKFICAEHKREASQIYINQKDLEKNLIILKSIEHLKKKGGRNFKNNIDILKSFIPQIEPYLVYENISKQMKDKTKQIMLLNMVYIAFQLENIKESHYIYFKLGEKIYKYFDIFNSLIKYLIEQNKANIKDLKKITKKEWNKIYDSFYSSKEYNTIYKEPVIKIGARYFKIFKELFFNVTKSKRLELKKEIKLKIEKVLALKKIKKYKYKLPLIEKPIEWGPELSNIGGWHTKEIRHNLVKENINEGHELEFNYKRIYPIINKMQSIEYTINIEWLDFLLENKEKIYEVLLNDTVKDSVAYKTKREQYDIVLNIAIYMSNYEKFYFTYEMDYRGRLYVEQEYLNYQGNLLARSLIQWFKPKQKNNFFLKIACVSLYKDILNQDYTSVLNYYNDNILNIELSNWYEHLKKAKEPILWLALFFELKNNKLNETKQIIWFDATCSGSQLLSLFVDDDSFLKELNLIEDNKINDYYTAIYTKYGGFKNIEAKHARKLIKKVVMTINYGLTLIGCHRYFFIKLKELNYCSSKEEYKEKWKNEVIKFYNFINNLSLVKNLEELQEIWVKLSSKSLIYQFILGDKGIIVSNEKQDNYIFKMKTICYKKYYKNLSLYNKSRKMKEKGFKYLWHHKRMWKLEQYRKIKANLIHMLDATWNILTCEQYNDDIATIHDCHGIHSYDVLEWFDAVKKVLVKMFQFNKYYYLLEDMLKHYYKSTNDIVFYNKMKKLIIKYEPIFSRNILKWWKIRNSKYLFIPK